jgi:protein-fructosamine 3-kinase/protein-ribulosamine 3-kinase
MCSKTKEEISLIRDALKTTTLKPHGRSGGGSINEGRGYMTDLGPVFIKQNRNDKARQMFDGEFASLEALYATKTVRVPKPVAV